MERRLLHGIMTPAMLATLGFGLLLAGDPGCRRLASGLDLGKARPGRGAARLSGWLARWRRAFAAERNRHSPRFFRMVNELPTLALIAIVVLVVVKPF